MWVTPSSVHFMQRMRTQRRKGLSEVLCGLENSYIELCSDAFLCFSMLCAPETLRNRDLVKRGQLHKQATQVHTDPITSSMGTKPNIE